MRSAPLVLIGLVTAVNVANAQPTELQRRQPLQLLPLHLDGTNHCDLRHANGPWNGYLTLDADRDRSAATLDGHANILLAALPTMRPRVRRSIENYINDAVDAAIDRRPMLGFAAFADSNWTIQYSRGAGWSFALPPDVRKTSYINAPHWPAARLAFAAAPSPSVDHPF
jgi:hypothetical protein